VLYTSDCAFDCYKAANQTSWTTLLQRANLMIYPAGIASFAAACAFAGVLVQDRSLQIYGDTEVSFRLILAFLITCSMFGIAAFLIYQMQVLRVSYFP
jgi:hypothetical protein